MIYNSVLELVGNTPLLRLNNIEKENNILVYAVCGAGKTEIIVKVIERTLKKGGKVGIIIPRRDLVVELGKRIFNSTKCKITSPEDLIPLVKHYTLEKVEYFIAVSLNGAHEIIEIKEFRDIIKKYNKNC
mgnify:CR=1 FL=1